MSLELSTDRIVCSRCGTAFGKRAGNFSVSYAPLYLGVGHLPLCRACVEKIFEGYLSQCNDARLAVRQTCRKLDLYWDNKIYDSVASKATLRSVMAQYITKVASKSYRGKSYDDTLEIEGKLWDFTDNTAKIYANDPELFPESEPEQITEEVMAFWGSGYTPTMYRELEQRRRYWMSKFPRDTELDIGTEAIIRQICSLELDINRDRSAGRSVEKSITALNTLLGSANLKPVQKQKDDLDASIQNTPMGVWAYRYENERPIPDVYEDSQILKYIFTWMGHLCKMVGTKDNKYTRLYEEEIAKYTVDKPEYDGDEEDALLDAFDSVQEEDDDGYV